ncbi:similar to Saccharomyces cerevisiae YMR300C ADE4 Phosphoribosylpyrophosphate amidotransferase [Maudiozyma barnettii]|uniref:Amidophosphoribosyltransferase n=1 Tax=Maudiozyma barnettii TaxID=61262 RepID=A0A8H2VD70_9SACH|nr:amidophosphoribosyltransferase [Kazachstania barnettii]CAB4253032.1 similar to Saccharomyces cerevisiae YMR300C ADE4 Phosphoribosylpyrophosphate amidotransferase [Kazachstania barnettii]CAD1780433.1 similar to Saccharomyces cerevisiae YMR300C ADE4 Phosphoribosylpyrophosphate amidotransferase [Kazachstania barnettii]
MCGILGIVLANQKDTVAPELCDACIYLQHRGQDAAGIATCGDRGRIFQCKGNGLARDVFTENRVAGLAGSMGIGHLRYPTAGSSANSEAQPFYVNSPYGVNMAHNGNLVNTVSLKRYMDEDVHRHINTDSDSELLLNIFAAELEKHNKYRVNNEDVFHALEGVYRLCRGGYACVGMLAGFALFGFRDPNGIRPLLYGERTNENGSIDYMLASESVVLDAHGFTNIRDLKPGEAVIIPKNCNAENKPEFRQVVAMNSYRPDVFEYVYFARPDSILDGISVYETRLNMGVKLAENVKKTVDPADIDVVIAVPDTARTCALQCAHTLGKPYREAFVKNRYVGRTFIMPNQKERVSSVRRKLNPMKTEFKGRNVLIVDDSIVRGTTSMEIVNMAKDAGAKKVYFASAAPPIRYNHIYGIDLTDNKNLIAYNKSEDEVAAALGCEKVIFQTLDDLIDCCKSQKIDKFEVGVFTGNYVTGVEDGYLQELERVRALNKKQQTARKSEVDVGLYNLCDD